MMTITRECVICEKRHSMNVSDDAYKKLLNGVDLIQNLLPDLNPMEREFVKSGYCPQCQQLLFGTEYTSEKIKMTDF